MTQVIIALGAVLGIMRPMFVVKTFDKHVNQTYQALAHIVVGYLFAVWWLGGSDRAGLALILLTAVEVVCATVTVLKR